MKERSLSFPRFIENWRFSSSCANCSCEKDVKRNLRNSERSRYEAEQVSQLLKKQLDDVTTSAIICCYK